MIYFNNWKYPNGLIGFKKENSPSSTPLYDLLTTELKNQIREALAENQNYLCGYCNKNIGSKNNLSADVRIEHFSPRSLINQRNPRIDDSLDTDNLILCCCGKFGTQLHCDQAKGNRLVAYNPRTQPNISALVEYNFTICELTSSDDGMLAQIETLNLNERALTEFRKADLQEVKRFLINKRFTRSVLNRLLSDYQTNKVGKDFPALIEFFLLKKIQAIP